jgi:Gas vesicle protein
VSDELATRRQASLVDLVDRLLAGGVVIAGDITLSVADVDLVHVGLQLLVRSVEEDGVAPLPEGGPRTVEVLP